MELRFVDPKTLLVNPNNPRTGDHDVEEDRRLALNIKTVGLIHPPTVREGDDGRLTIVAGHRRSRASILAKLTEIAVIVTSSDPALDDLAAGSENVVRQAMSRPAEWAWVERMRREKRFTDKQLSKALLRTETYIRGLGRLANLHPPILHAIEIGLGPDDEVEKLLAMTPIEQQREIWAEIFSDDVENGEDPAEYRLKADATSETVPWADIGWRLKETRFFASEARFDSKVANMYGVHWDEDLFGQGGADNRFTTNGSGYAAAQKHWLDNFRPENTVVMERNDYGRPETPAGFRPLYGWAPSQEGDTVGYFIEPNSLKITEHRLRPTEDRDNRSGSSDLMSRTSDSTPKERADISGTGDKMIGEIRTDALHKALSGAVDTVDPWDLVAALLLAFAGSNVRIQGDSSYDYRHATASKMAVYSLFPEGVLVRDPALLREHAIAVLKSAANCDVSMHSGSGLSAQLMGILFDADREMPNMAFEEFLKTYSKPGITKALESEGLQAQSTGKQMRAALMAHVGEGRWVPQAAGFAQAAGVWSEHVAKEAAKYARRSEVGDSDEEEGDGDYDDDHDLNPSDAGASETQVELSDEAEGGSASEPNAAPDDVAAQEETPEPETYDPTPHLEALEKLAADYRGQFANTAEGREHFDNHVAFVAV